MLDAKRARVPGAPVIHDEPEARVVIPITYDPKTNLAGQVRIDVGDLQRGLAEADVVVEREFKAHYAQHCPIEPHITLAMFDEDGRLVLSPAHKCRFTRGASSRSPCRFRSRTCA